MSEVYYHWEYYQSLERKLEATEQFVNHSCDDKGDIINKKVYSYEFQHILLLIGVEFESVAKMLCKLTDSEYVVNHKNIAELSKVLLDSYPSIREVEIISDFMCFYPLKKYEVINKKVIGLDWWKAYNSIKHDGFNGFRDANLENVIYGMGALYIFELYYVQIVLKKTMRKKTNYFRSKYEVFSMTGSGPLLPEIE